MNLPNDVKFRCGGQHLFKKKENKMSLVLFLCLMLMALYSRPGKFALHSLYYVAQHNHGTEISHYFIRSDLQYLNKRVISRLKHLQDFPK